MRSTGDSPAPSTADTRAALLQAAAAEFAEAGYHDATIRAICRRAGANVAAVHYHFGDKEQLYLAVLRHLMDEANRRLPFDMGLGPQSAPAARLRALVRSLLGRLLEPGPHAWLGRLVARELLEPTPALEVMIREHIRPMSEQLRSVITAILGSDRDEQTLGFCGLSIVSQCFFYFHCRAVVSRLLPDLPQGPAAVGPLTEHITRFSLAALEKFARRPVGAGTRRAPTPPPRSPRVRRRSPRHAGTAAFSPQKP